MAAIGRKLPPPPASNGGVVIYLVERLRCFSLLKWYPYGARSFGPPAGNERSQNVAKLRSSALPEDLDDSSFPSCARPQPDKERGWIRLLIRRSLVRAQVGEPTKSTTYADTASSALGQT